MRQVLMMMLPDCPYCKMADNIIEHLVKEYPCYEQIEIRRIDESIEKDFADSLDYYYVPTFFVDGVKLMEGVPDKGKVKAVLDAALE